jgi:hypothetical protein
VLSETYVRLVLAVAPLVVVLAWSAEGARRTEQSAAVASALLFAASLFLPALAVWGVVPWLAVCARAALRGLRRMAAREGRDTADWSRLAAHLYLPIGGVWALFHEAGYQPLGFSAVIVLLTGVHFHYAGFALPWLSGRLLSRGPSRAGQRAGAWGVIAGVPLVAIGITSSQLRLPWQVETAAVTLLASSAFVISYGYLAWAGQAGGASGGLFLLGGVALALGMVLALLYGWRYLLAFPWVTIPAMYTLHGTLNSWGFCVPAILGNRLLPPLEPGGRGGAPGEKVLPDV